MIFEVNCERRADDVVVCNKLLYSYKSALACLTIASDFFWATALTENWILLLERLGGFIVDIGDNIEGSTIVFFCEKKLKGEG